MVSLMDLRTFSIRWLDVIEKNHLSVCSILIFPYPRDDRHPQGPRKFVARKLQSDSTNQRPTGKVM